LTEGESPAVKTGTESDGTLVGVDLDITKCGVMVCGDEDVDGFDCTRERPEQVLFGDLKLKKGTINLVDDDDRLDTFRQGLTEYSLCLYADTFNAIYDDQSTVGNTERCSDLGGEIYMTGRIDKIDQELVA